MTFDVNPRHNPLAGTLQGSLRGFKPAAMALQFFQDITSRRPSETKDSNYPIDLLFQTVTGGHVNSRSKKDKGKKYKRFLKDLQTIVKDKHYLYHYAKRKERDYRDY